MSVLLWSLVAVPAVLGGSLVIAGIGGVRGADRRAAPVGVAGAVVVLGIAVAVAVGRPRVSMPFLAGAPFALAVDGLSAVLVLTVATVAPLVLLFAAGDAAGDQRRAGQARFSGLMLVFVAAVLVTATATNLATLLFAWELMGAASWALIATDWRSPRSVGSGTTAFLTTRAGDIGLYVAAGAALAGATLAGGGLAGGASLSLSDLPTLAPGWRDIVAGGILLAALGKAAQLPFSFWLARAMDGPSPVSALLHSAAMVAMGGYLLLRTSPLMAATGWADDTAAWVGAVTALVLGAVAVVQRDLKQLLAASTAAQLGFVVLAAGVGSVTGGTMHLVAHAATKALLFLAAGAWLSALGTRQLSALRGAGRRYRVVGATFAVGGLALAGLPPLSLWATKDEILAAVLARSPALYVVGLAAAALSAVYAGRAVVMVLGPVPVDPGAGYDTEAPGTRRVDTLQRIPLVVLAAASAVLGVQALPPVAAAYRGLLGAPAEPTPGGWQLGVSAVLAVAALGLAVARPARPLPWPGAVEGALVGWLGLEPAAHALLVRPTLRLARLLAAVDDRGLHRVVAAVPGAVRAAATVARRVDERGVDGLVGDVATGTRRLGVLARRPQTGQLHQYYAQAAVGLAAAVLLLLVR